MTPWWSGIAPAQATVTCREDVHRLRFEEGALHAIDHEDIEGERTLAALGGERCTCVDLLDAWARRSGDPHVLSAASRGPADPLRTDDGSGRPLRRLPGQRRMGAAAGWTASTAIGQKGHARTGSALEGDDELAALLTLGGGLPDRLVATVVHRLRSASVADERTRWQLHAALYGRATAGVQSWLGNADRPLDLVLVEEDEVPGARELADGRVELALSIAWLGDVWARGLSVVAGRFCLAASSRDGRTIELLAVAPDLRTTETLELGSDTWRRGWPV